MSRSDRCASLNAGYRIQQEHEDNAHALAQKIITLVKDLTRP